MKAPRTIGARLGCLLALLAWCAGCAPEPPSPEPATFDPDSVPSAFAQASAFLTWPGATRSVHVDAAGGLDDGAATLSLTPSVDGDAAPAPGRIAFEHRWLPIAHWRRHSGSVRFDFEAVALPHAAPRDTALWVSVLVTATNQGSAPAEATLDMAIGHPVLRTAFVALDLEDADSAPAFAGGGARAARAWLDTGAGGSRATWSRSLTPGASAAARIVWSTYTLPAGEFATWARAPHPVRAREARRFWEGEVSRAARFELGDPETEDALRAAWVVLLSCRERRGQGWVPIGGPFHYRDVWLRDGARAVNALAISGFATESMELVRGLSRLQWADGALISQRGQLDGLGQGPWAYAQAALRRGTDTSSVAKLAASALRVWRYRQWLRSFARGLASPHASMLPVAEPRDGELTRGQFVGNDAWAIAGSVATERLLRAAGRTSEADSVAATIARDRDEFHRALATTGRPDVPPSWQSRGLDWGNLAVGWPCRALSPDDPRLSALARRVWAAAGDSGLVTYGEPGVLHNYLGADLGTWALIAGRPADSQRVLAALLRWRDASGAGAETIERATGNFGRNLPPHPTSAAALVTLVRNSLVYDDDDTLRLALGTPEKWWKGARLARAPTRWGALDLDIHHDGREASYRWTPVPVWTEVSLPSGARLDEPPAPPLVAARRGRSVLAPPGTTEARLRFARAAEAR